MTSTGSSVAASADPEPDDLGRWNPWRALRARPSVTFWFASLGGDRGRWIRGPRGDEILLDPSLDRQTRAEVLAHELVHAERGVGFPDATAATMQLEEERVWRIALDRLAPPAQVHAFIERRTSVGSVGVTELAEEFDLSPATARRLADLHLARAGIGR